MKKTLLLILGLPFLIGSTCEIKQDTSQYSAIQGGDLTLVFSGGSEKHRDGIILWKVSEDSNASGSVSVTIPELNCDRDSCALFNVVRKDGSIYPLGGLKKGQTKITFSLTDLIGHQKNISVSDGGPYRILMEAYYEWDDEEWKVLGSGIVYVLVLKKGYVSLGCNGPDVAWASELEKNCEAQFTTKMRTALCGTGCYGTGN